MILSRPLVLVCAACLAAGVVLAANDDAPPVPPGPQKPRGEFHPGGDGKQRGMFPFGMFHGAYEAYDTLSEDDKRRVRDALNKAWSTPEMEAARDKLMKANTEFRESLRRSLEGIDPEVAKIVDKVKPAMPGEFRGPPPLRPEDPEFVKHALARLGMEMQPMMARPDQREALRKLHERVLELPVIKDLVSRLQSAPVGERMALFKTLREAYQKEVQREIADFRKKREAKEPEAPVQPKA